VVSQGEPPFCGLQVRKATRAGHRLAAQACVLSVQSGIGLGDLDRLDPSGDRIHDHESMIARVRHDDAVVVGPDPGGFAQRLAGTGVTGECSTGASAHQCCTPTSTRFTLLL
jgi:hypothetical protein